MTEGFRVAVLTLPGLTEPSTAIAATRAGELGLLDLEYAKDQGAALRAVKRLAEAVKSNFGIKLNGDRLDFIAKLLSELPDRLKTVILTSTDPQVLRPLVSAFREKKVAVLIESNCLAQAQLAQAMEADGVVAKGHEAGGRVSDETTFILLQRFLSGIRLPIWTQGGIGLHTAGACAGAGAAGVILDSQLALTRESPLGDAVRARIASMDGSETICLGAAVGETYRIYFRPGGRAVEELRQIETRLAGDERSPAGRSGRLASRAR